MVSFLGTRRASVSYKTLIRALAEVTLKALMGHFRFLRSPPGARKLANKLKIIKSMVGNEKVRVSGHVRPLRALQGP